MLKTRKQINWPDLTAIQDAATRAFGEDIGILLVKRFQDIYEDLRALQFSENVDALPTAAGEHRGRFLLLKGGAGVRDEIYVCRKNAADAYEWAAVTIP